MRYLALAADYDGTLAHDGHVDDPTIAALERLRGSGRRLVMVTGRELDELLAIFPPIELFDRVVAENGALLYRPQTREEVLLAERPPEGFIAALRRRGVGPISVGRAIVATWEPHQTTVLETIKEMGLELQVIFNKGAVMILPTGVNKATGLTAALDELGLSPHNAVGIGDAENDHAFLALCECSAAVANALPAIQERADFVTQGDHGAGVVELIERLEADDLQSLAPRLVRHEILLGKTRDGGEERIAPYGVNILVAGTSGSGKSTMTTGFLERLAGPGYQYLIADPEGDYSTLEGAVVLGDPHREPTVEEMLELLKPVRQNVVVNLLGIALEHRPAFFQGLLPHLQELRARTGRPHWIVVDEAHHLLPATWEPATLTLPLELRGMLFITVHPGSMARAVLESVDLVLVVGEAPERTIREFCEAIGQAPPALGETTLERGEALAWRRRAGVAPVRLHPEPPRTERSRHLRKYAEGNLGPDRSFRFRGPKGTLNLRAQNLVLFLQMAEGVDDETWMYHLRRGDYSAWFREGIKDDQLATEAEAIERQADASPQETRAAIRALIERRYTLPSDKPSGEITPD
ncbi:MAG: HAD-IIB family hydrolase [Isosphaeraceae bacterium]|nr:HAD-IIB family hydrolase [Isosphaeraceae bacterium]